MIKDLTEIVAIPSVESEPSGDNAPFGTEVRRALDWFLDKAKSYGLKTGENKGYYGWADYGDEDKPIIGILTHIDIVPAGEGWVTDPFTVTQEGETLYGRGVADNKGALCMALHMLKKFKEDGKKFKHRIRLIVGCNEETGCKCLEKYALEEEIPVVSLVPDSSFPLIHCEKGIVKTVAEFAPDKEFKNAIEYFYSGERTNVVPGKAEFKYIKTDFSGAKPLAFGKDYLNFAMPKKYLAEVGATADDFEFDRTNNGLKMLVHGVPAHASTPLEGKNAVWNAWAFLNGNMPQSPFTQAMMKLCSPSADEYMGIKRNDEKTGELTMNMGVTKYEAGGNLRVEFDFRIPRTITPDEVLEAVKNLPFCVKAENERVTDMLYFDPESDLVKTLLSIYNEETGDYAKSIITGGGTYAKCLPNALAFGINFPGEQENMHKEGEKVKISSLNKAKEIYLKAIEKLDQLY